MRRVERAVEREDRKMEKETHRSEEIKKFVTD